MRLTVTGRVRAGTCGAPAVQQRLAGLAYLNGREPLTRECKEVKDKRLEVPGSHAPIRTL